LAGVRQLVDSQTDFDSENFVFNVIGNSILMIHLECQKYILLEKSPSQFFLRFLTATPTIGQVIVLVCLSASIHAQTLPEVVNQALQTYPTVMSASFKAAATRTDITRARSAHFPQLGLTATTTAFSSGTVPNGTERSSISPTARINLWSGGKIEAEAERAEALSMASDLLYANTLDDVAMLAAEAYLNWAKTADLYSLAVKNVNAHRETLSDIQKIAKADTGRRVDYEQALVRMENATLALQQRKSDFSQAIQRVRRFWKGEMDARPVNLESHVSDSGVLGKLPTSLAQAMAMVSDDLPSIAQARAQVSAAQASVRVAKSQYWPTVDMSVSHQLNSNTGQREAYTQLQVTAPFYNGGGTSALVEGAVGQLKAAEFTLEEARLLAREKAAVAWQDWVSAQDRANTGSSQSLVGERLVTAYRDQFRVARRSLLDLLNIQSDVFNYRSSAQAAFHDERLARVRLLAATGDLARRFSAEPGRVLTPAR
jgi:TolC family type I secretion outer membrane protein